MSDFDFDKVPGGWWDWPWYRKAAAWLRYAPIHNARAVIAVVRQWACLRLGIRPPMAWVTMTDEPKVSGWDRTDEFHGAVEDSCSDWKDGVVSHGLKYERMLSLIWDLERDWSFKVDRTYVLRRPE